MRNTSAPSRTNTTIVPDGLDFPTATVVTRHAPTALHLLRDRAKVQPGEWVLVMGAAGGLGSAGIQVAKYLGAKVIAAAGADERVKVGLDLGADAGVNYRAQDLTIEAMRITEGKGVNVVFENIGDPDAVSQGVRRDGAPRPAGDGRRPRRRHRAARRQPALSQPPHRHGRDRRDAGRRDADARRRRPKANSRR